LFFCGKGKGVGRFTYRPYQQVFNVDFRVVCAAASDAQTSVLPGGTPGPQVSEAK
jgi:hypothetical protein